MASTVQMKRRINGAAGSPGTTGAKEGEIAFNAPGAAGGTAKPTMYFFDGTAWRVVNPDANVTTQSIALTGGANIGAAFTTWAASPGNAITGSVVIATYGTPAQAYVLTNPTAPGVAASWTSLGGAVSYATGPQIITGTDSTVAINPVGLRAATTLTSAGAADSNKIPRLGAGGKLDASLLPAGALNAKGATDPTAVPPVGAVNGDAYFANKAGAANAGYGPGVTGNVGLGDMLLFDGTAWHLVPNATDLTAYVPLAGTNLMTGGIVWTGAANSKAGTTVIDGKGGTADGLLIDCGTYV
jgi:hypothetical protein